MKKLNQKASEVFNRMVEMAEGNTDNPNYIKIGKDVDDENSMMPVSVQKVGEYPKFNIWSVCHTYVQEGDLMVDPDVTFAVSKQTGEIYPLSFEMSGQMYRVYVNFNEAGQIESYNPHMQKDNALFCNDWMINIKNQQDINKVYRAWKKEQEKMEKDAQNESLEEAVQTEQILEEVTAEATKEAEKVEPSTEPVEVIEETVEEPAQHDISGLSFMQGVKTLKELMGIYDNEDVKGVAITYNKKSGDKVNVDLNMDSLEVVYTFKKSDGSEKVSKTQHTEKTIRDAVRRAITYMNKNASGGIMFI